jgi:DNA repair exonuclease SbcCD ATPase subunit
VAEDKLRSDGSTDPAAELAMARARSATAREHLLRLQRHADATQLLHQTFAAEQQAMADRFTAPLADRISGYLECIFGAGTRAVVQFEKQAFAGLHLHRPHLDSGSLPFDVLSGGTREQTAAALRLAMAEVLAAGHDGTLPVLFDDAFTHSDPARLESLQNMLYLASERGLQIILLTCHPGDYAGLGARTVTL